MLENTNQWTNYGDVNPIEHGGIWVKPDTTEFPRSFYVITLNRVEDSAVERWQMYDIYVNVTDDTFEWDSVYSSTDTKATDSDVDKVIGLVHHYGGYQLNGTLSEFDDEDKLKKELTQREITI